MENDYWNVVVVIIVIVVIAVAVFAGHLFRIRSTRGRYAFYICNLPAIIEAVDYFSANLQHENGYFSYYTLSTWKNQYSLLSGDIEGKGFENINLKASQVDAIRQFKNYFKNAAPIRKEFNDRFVEEELERYCNFFDEIEGRKLDMQQRRAIIIDEDNNLIIAGAGSGKTTTIIGKIHYLIERYDIKPENLLVISFTNKSASTLAKRVNVDGVEAQTFHKFGKDVICEVEGVQPSVFDEGQFRPLLTLLFKQLSANNNDNYVEKLTKYFTQFLKPIKKQDEFLNQGDYIQYLKEQNFKPYKIQAGSGRSFGREKVKSIEECQIANFFLFNGIDYEYESPYQYHTASREYRQYKPDFTVKDKNGNLIYIEHFAINKKGQVPAFFADEGQSREEATKRYAEGIEWKRKLHRENRTQLIETFSHEMHDGVLFDNLTRKLEGAGVVVIPKSPEEIWNIISESAKEEVEHIVSLIETFIVLMKSNNYCVEDLERVNKGIHDELHRKRNRAFIDIVAPVYSEYEKHLKERNEIDFSDMINKATGYISEGAYKCGFKYLIIDEFQDMSIGRYKMIRGIKDKMPECKLFCVGDDWQSIYRFTGSDISLLKEFGDYFGYSVISRIETTYRFSNPLLNLSSEFIQKNPNQIPKELNSQGLVKLTTFDIIYSESKGDDSLAVKGIFDTLMDVGHIKNKKILILSRYNYDINRIKDNTNGFHVEQRKGRITYAGVTGKGKAKKIGADFLTVHKAKGLEADIVIVINCNAGKHGFPSEISDDSVLDLLLTEADQFMNGEERRLFYVAMTRAKEKLFFVSERAYKSKFISELEGEKESELIDKCPRCRSSYLVLRQGISPKGRHWSFYGCSNYPYCEYQRWIS